MSNEPGRTRRTTKWRWVFGLLLFAALIWYVGPETLLYTLANVDRWLLFFLVMTSLTWLLLGALNVWILLTSLTDFSLRRFVGIYISSWSASLFLPSQLGDATQIFLLKAEGVQADQSTAAYTIDKVFSLTLLGAVSGYGILRFTSGDVALGSVGAALSVIVLFSLSVFFIFSRTNWPLIARLQRFMRSVLVQLLRFRTQKRSLAINASLTCVKWLIAALLYWLAFVALGTTIPFEAALTIPFVSSLVAYIPITVGGLGTMEMTGVALFGEIGVSSAAVVSVYILVRASLIVTAILILSARALPGVRG